MTDPEADLPADEADVTDKPPPDVHHDHQCAPYRDQHGVAVTTPADAPVLGPGAARALLRILIKANRWTQ
jgi:hypothetical protein